MIFTATRGKAFREEFSFKNEKGQPLAVPSGEYALFLERGHAVTEGTLRVTRNTIFWTMTADETAALKYSTMYFHLTFNGQEISRGVLRVN